MATMDIIQTAHRVHPSIVRIVTAVGGVPRVVERQSDGRRREPIE
jgi:hypothetical protein